MLETAYRLLPKSSIRAIRKALERLSVAKLDKQNPTPDKNPIAGESLAALEELLRKDQTYYHQLFESSPIVLGSDAPSPQQHHV